MALFEKSCLFTCVLLLLETSIEGKIVETKVIPQWSCGNVESFKSVEIECELLKYNLIANFQIGGSTIPFVLDTGSYRSLVLNSETTYLLIKKEANNIVREIKDYGNDWKQFFFNPPLNMSVPDTTDVWIRQSTYNFGELTVEYQVVRNPIELSYDNWMVKLNVDFVVRVMRQIKHKVYYSGILGLSWAKIPSMDIMGSLLYQSHYQHNETSYPMISVDINLKRGIPTEPSYFGFGQPAMPIGIERRNIISMPSLSTDWLIEVKYIKLQLWDNEYCFYQQHYALLDTGGSMLFLPEELRFKVPAKERNYTFGDENFPLDLWSQYIPNIHIGFGDSEIIIPAEYLYYMLSKGNMWKSMLRSIDPKEISRTSRVYHSLLGVPFFSVVYTEFHFSPANILGVPNVDARVDMISKIQ